jgi:hypothetical protein
MALPLRHRTLVSRFTVAALAGSSMLLAGCGAETLVAATAGATPVATAVVPAPTATAAPVPTATDRAPIAIATPFATATAASEPAPSVALSTVPAGAAAPATVVVTPQAVATIAGSFGTEAPTNVSLMPAVREYCYYLKQAIVSGNVGVLWQRYPALQQGANATTGAGIDVESYYVNEYRQLHLFDGDISPEEYAPIRVKLGGDRAEVLVHGSESYLRLSYDNAGKPFFDVSSQEFVVQLFLQRQGGIWTVMQTDWPGMSAYTGRTRT